MNLNVLLDIEKSKKNKTSNVLIKTMVTSSILKIKCLINNFLILNYYHYYTIRLDSNSSW
jgi:hypothetical protein